ncbi:hypothetical protein [Niveibacterium sp.]|uniref:hypothetical protein n=1 Tax=Niveibacterium sp. TaxID=2017444 RepID=UPI0035B07935
MELKIGYADFRALTDLTPRELKEEWLELRADGVYKMVEPQDSELTGAEAAGLTSHPTGNLLEPALQFPCTLKELKRFIADEGLTGQIDAFVMADWLMKHAFMTHRDTPRGTEQSSNSLVDSDVAINKRAETTLLNIIGALLSIMLSRTPGGTPQSVFKSQDAIADALVAHHPNVPGIKLRTLQEKFAAARKSLAAS